jgi:hypothetical protein
VDRDDVRVVQPGGGPRLLLEALAAIGVVCELLRENLDRELAPEALVARAVHLAHASRAEGSEDLVRTELLPRRERHA